MTSLKSEDFSSCQLVELLKHRNVDHDSSDFQLSYHKAIIKNPETSPELRQSVLKSQQSVLEMLIGLVGRLSNIEVC